MLNLSFSRDILPLQKFPQSFPRFIKYITFLFNLTLPQNDVINISHSANTIISGAKSVKREIMSTVIREIGVRVKGS